VENLGRTSERGEVTACGCKQEKQHQRGSNNNLQPMSGCWLQEQEHHMRQRDIEAPMSGCRLSQQQATPEKQQPTTNERLLAASNTREATATTYNQ